MNEKAGGDDVVIRGGKSGNLVLICTRLDYVHRQPLQGAAAEDDSLFWFVSEWRNIAGPAATVLFDRVRRYALTTAWRTTAAPLRSHRYDGEQAARHLVARYPELGEYPDCVIVFLVFLSLQAPLSSPDFALSVNAMDHSANDLQT